jgi:hypothetical protein
MWGSVMALGWALGIRHDNTKMKKGMAWRGGSPRQWLHSGAKTVGAVVDGRWLDWLAR